jgi:hypothetical protein
MDLRKPPYSLALTKTDVQINGQAEPQSEADLRACVNARTRSRGSARSASHADTLASCLMRNPRGVATFHSPAGLPGMFIHRKALSDIRIPPRTAPLAALPHQALSFPRLAHSSQLTAHSSQSRKSDDILMPWICNKRGTTNEGQPPISWTA